MAPSWLSGAVLVIVLVQALQLLDPRASNRLSSYAPTNWDAVSAITSTAVGSAGGVNAGGANSTPAGEEDAAVVLVTRAPISPLAYERIYQLARDVSALPPIKDGNGYYTGGGYRFAVLVEHDSDVSSALQSQKLPSPQERSETMYESAEEYKKSREEYGRSTRGKVEGYVKMHRSDVPIPLVMDVAPNVLEEAYPSLANGTLKVNTLAAPALALFMRQYHFRHAWRIEDDVHVVGRDNLARLVRRWDIKLAGLAAASAGILSSARGVKGDGADLAGEPVHPASEPSQISSLNMLFRRECLVDNCSSSAEEWRCYSHSLIRFSRAFAEYLHGRIREGQFRRGECYLGALVEQGGFSGRTLSELLRPPRGVGGLVEALESGKRQETSTRTRALRKFVNDTDLSSYVFRNTPATS